MKPEEYKKKEQEHLSKLIGHDKANKYYQGDDWGITGVGLEVIFYRIKNEFKYHAFRSWIIIAAILIATILTILDRIFIIF
jgi:hypothetical protein